MKKKYCFSRYLYFSLGMAMLFQLVLPLCGLTSSWESSVSSLRLSIEELSDKNREVAQKNQRLVEQIKLLKKEEIKMAEDNHHFSSEQQVLERLLKEKEKVILYLSSQIHGLEQKEKNFLETVNVYRKGLDQRQAVAEELRKNVSILDQDLIDLEKKKNDQEQQYERDYFHLEDEMKVQADLLLKEKQENQSMIEEISKVDQHYEKNFQAIQSLREELSLIEQGLASIREGQEMLAEQKKKTNLIFEDFIKEEKELIANLDQDIHALEIEKDRLSEQLLENKKVFESLRLSADREDEMPSLADLKKINQENQSLNQQLGHLKRYLANINAQIKSIQDLLTR
jgi:cell division protein FtsB